MPDLDSEAVDFRAASESFAPVRKLTKRDLETLRLVTTHQGRRVPTIGGIVLFGRDRDRHFPDAWIQAERFGGTDKARILDQAEIRTIPGAQSRKPSSSSRSTPCAALRSARFADRIAGIRRRWRFVRR